VFWLMADPDRARAQKILKVDHPKLVKVLGGKRTSWNDFHDTNYVAALRAVLAKNAEQLTAPINKLAQRASHLERLEEEFAIVPRSGEWLAPSQVPHGSHSAEQTPQQKQDDAILHAWGALKQAIQKNDQIAGSKAVNELVQSVNVAVVSQGEELPQLRLDSLYQKHHPFAKSALFYVLAAIAFAASLLFGVTRASQIGFVLMSIGLLEEILGIAARWILSGRAPLANMYESFTFATAGMILVALIFEFMSKSRLAGLGGATLGFIFMVIAHKAPIFDSQIRPLFPALQSVWLTYHVVTIMLSYSAFALSFFASLCYLGKDALGGDNTRFGLVQKLPSLLSLDVFIYKIVAVGFPLLTIGIILGAVWANTAWGRAWGFDPKETWSLITWLVYLVYLHLRFIAGWKGRRTAVVALIGFACVIFTYIGVNYLLPGLHSYAG